MIRALCCVGLASVVAWGGVRAQDAARAPLEPDSVLTAGARDADFDAWRRAAAEHGRMGASFLVHSERYNVLVLTPMAVDLLAHDSLIVKLTRGCQLALQLVDADVERTSEIGPWTAFDAATRARPTIALAIMPADPIPVDCRQGQIPRFSAISRGVLYGVNPAYSPRYDARRAELRREGVLEPAILSGRAPVVKIGRGQYFKDGTEQLRLYLEPDVFAPDPDGRPARLELHVWDPVSDVPEILPIPEEVIRAVWQQLLPWRATLLGAGGERPREPIPMHLPVPRDSVLREAHARYQAGEFGRSAADALGRLTYRPMPRRSEVRDAMIQAASVFAAYGEDQAAIALLTDVMEVFPCLTFAPEAPALLRSIAESVRPMARCTSVPLPLIALRSIVPGGGTWTSPGRRNFALTMLASTAGSYLVAAGLRAYSRSEYEKYLAYAGTTNAPPEAIYGRVELARTLGNAATIGAVSVWVFSALEALYTEHRHARALDEVRDVGRPRRSARLAPVMLPQGLALAVQFR